MKRNELMWGGLLVGAGALLLLQNLGLLGPAQDTIWTLLFAVTGAAFLGLFLTNRALWWPLIPAFVFFSLAAIVGLQAITPGFATRWNGSIILGGIALGFWTIYATHPKLWWAIIPGGVLTTLAIVAGIGQASAGQVYAGGVFFLGLAVTFGLVYLLPTPPNRMRWALIPAGVAGVLGLISLTATASILNYVWPIALILVGLYLMYRTLGGRTTRSVADAPPQPATRREERYDEPTLPQPH